MMSLLDLPLELVVNVLGRVGLDGLVACSQVSWRAREIVLQTPQLVYYTYLDRTGMCDNPSSKLSLRERLDNLIAYNNAWLMLRWSRHSVIRMPADVGFKCEQTVLSRGVRAGAPSYGKDNFAQTLVRIPAPLRGVPESTEWDVSFHGFKELPAWTMDPSQDLLLLCQPDGARQRVRTKPLMLSNCRLRHPRAKVDFFESGWVVGSTGTLCGDRIITQGTPRNFMVNKLVDWTTATRTGQVSEPTAGMERAFFLDAKHVVSLKDDSTRPWTKSIAVSKASASGPTTINGEAGEGECVLVAEFLLPDFIKHAYGNVHSLSRSPAPSHDASATVGDFSYDPSGTLISLVYSNLISQEGSWLSILVPSQLLLSYLAAHPHPEDIPQVVPWEDWGPKNASIYYDPEIGRVVTNFYPPRYGLRTIPYDRPVQIQTQGEDGVQYAVIVDDYHPRRVEAARARSKLIPPGRRNWAVLESATLRYSERFMRDGKPLTTYLPHIRSYQLLPPEVVGDDPGSVKLSIFEDSIIASVDMNSRRPEDRTPYDVHIFSF